MRKKLLPALFSLYLEKKFSQKFYLVGFARRDFTDEQFRGMLKESLKLRENEEAWSTFSKNIYYQQGLFETSVGYESLIKKLKKFDDEIKACITRFFYLATPPDNYAMILDNMTKTKLDESCGEESLPQSGIPLRGKKLTKIIIEKPFGKDLQTARDLDKRLSEIFKEDQIFRVDHYLGKETVQNMIAFRFANSVFEPVWNKNYIDHVQITWAEEAGISGRGKFFDGVGMLRDVGQNHLMQLVAAVVMEQPTHFSKEAIRDVRANAIKAINCLEADEVSRLVVRGQYEGYEKEQEVLPKSTTETFVAVKLFVNTDRFSGVPFYIRAGKKMPKNLVEINVVFIQTCHILFKEYGCPEEGNILKIRIQPDEGIGMRVIAKKPFGSAQGSPRGFTPRGTGLALTTVDMGFTYQEEFGGDGYDAYEKVLMDIFSGDQMLFNRSDELASSWEFITKILEGWPLGHSKVLPYKPGTWGPKEAQELIEKDGRKWIV